MPVIKDRRVAERNARQLFGCTLTTALALNEGKPLREVDSPAMKYLGHRQSATQRGIAWQFTFPEWMQIWCASGKWSERGQGKFKYGMARLGATGPFNHDNVLIRTHSENSREGIAKVGCMRKGSSSHRYSAPVVHVDAKV